MKHIINLSNERQLHAIQIIDYLKKWFNNLSYEEKILFKEKHPDLVKTN